ncbi:FAD/NAD(P)-binding domain-containing protein [Parathielavia appendiculata]|uniref:FAD/NAD(P)-binding domain-containing protein n=1 Tax=Parathielavia appendiculata TaxID=2587402 RepID=A0AAN6U4W0_9PEZI|nr:FAD/NAD(P)-binding domain-containing protein [Parathielavia appendiculata]
MRQHIVLVGCFLAPTAAAVFTDCRCKRTIVRDVAVVGGGASGAHAAVWLRDNGQSVVVVEKAAQLGGHTAYYHDAVSGKDINVGVQGWIEYKDSLDFPKRMNVSSSRSMSFTPNVAQYIDTKTGKPVPNYKAPATADMNAAMQRYLDVLEQYENMVLPGFFNFPEPENIPEDLLMPFVDFVEKYNLSAAVPQVWDSTAMGLGDTMNMPTLWVMQASGVPMVRAMLGQAASVVPASGRLYDLFESVASFLGGDVLYSSTVLSATRPESSNNPRQGVSLHVRGTDGQVTCIEAKRLVIAIEPTPENMAPFNLDTTESSVLGKFRFPTVYAGILRHPSLQTLTAYTARTTDPASYNYTSFPVAPQLGRIEYLGDTKDLFHFWAVGTTSDTTASMQARIQQSIDAMIASGVLLPPPDGGSGGSGVEFELFANHGHMHAYVSADELRAGFVQKLNALQGRRHTWYTGGAFSAGFSTVLWEFNKVLLPSVVEGL